MSFWRKDVIDFALSDETRRQMAEQREWIGREPANPSPYFHLAQFYRIEGRQDEALGLLLEAVRLDSAFAAAHAALAEIYAIRADYAAAWRHARAAESNGDPSAVNLLNRYSVGQALPPVNSPPCYPPPMSPEPIASRRAHFRELHETGCFVIPNPWDIGTARCLQDLGFPALATTSSGFAFSRALPDGAGAVTRDMALAHIAEIAGAVDLPVNADFESGYAPDLAGVAENVRLCAAAGVAGLSIEDSTGNPERPLYDLQLAVERVKTASAALSGTGVLLTARAECFLTGHPDPLPEAIRRLQAYAEAGADVLYAPGPRDRGQIEAIVSAVRPKPVNVLVSSDLGLSVADLAALGVRRISVGSALARAAWGGFLRAARAIAEHGSFAGFAGAEPFAGLNDFFQRDLAAVRK